jgi:hypothetical protein
MKELVIWTMIGKHIHEGNKQILPPKGSKSTFTLNVRPYVIASLPLLALLGYERVGRMKKLVCTPFGF